MRRWRLSLVAAALIFLRLSPCGSFAGLPAGTKLLFYHSRQRHRLRHGPQRSREMCVVATGHSASVSDDGEGGEMTEASIASLMDPIAVVGGGLVTIELVDSKHRALDLRVFRGFIPPASSLLGTNAAPSGSDGPEEAAPPPPETEEDSVDRLMVGYDDAGRCENHVGPNDHPAHFVAVCRGGAPSRGANGVVGAVDAQVRRPAPGGIGGGEDDGGPLGRPHVFLKNLAVDERFWGLGVGAALVSAVEGYARTCDWEPRVDCIVLDVDVGNANAMRLYERVGYERLEDLGPDAVIMIKML